MSQPPLRGISVPCGNYSIQNNNNNNEYLNEDTPLLTDGRTNRLQKLEKILLVIFLSAVVATIFMGTHLLLTEGKELKALGEFNQISREAWRAHVPLSTMAKMKLPVTRVLFLKTNSSCDSQSQCSQLVLELQLNHMLQLKEPDILYNFLITGDGSIFEGRGWNFKTKYKDSLVVAFIGHGNLNTLTLKQVKSAKLFLDVNVMEGRLDPCYNIMVWGSNRFLIDLAEDIQNTLSRCKN